MQLNSEKRLLLLGFLVVLFAYFPVTSSLFAIKNDFFTAYFPLKRFLTISLHEGVFPLWNPFLNYGFPIYGDLSEAWWNPGTWIVAVMGYTPWTFTLELIAYLLLAFFSMYKLSSLWIQMTFIRFIAALSYVCSGYFISHIQHFNWIAGMACFPLFIYHLLKYLQTGHRKNLAGSGLTGIWFLTAAHPGLIIGGFLFTIPLLFDNLFLTKDRYKRIIFVTTLVLAGCAGMIYGYAEVMPHTNRLNAVSELITPEGSTLLLSWISGMLPLSTVKANWLYNDLALRNSYFGILPFAGLALTILQRKNHQARLFLFVGFFFMILSSEWILPVYKEISILNKVRLNGEFRIFAILGFILAGCFQLNIAWNDPDRKPLIRILRFIQLILGIVVLGILVMFPEALQLPSHTSTMGVGKIKYFLDQLSLSQTILIQAPIQILICQCLIRASYKNHLSGILRWGCFDLATSALLLLPFTGVGQRSLRNIATLYAPAPNHAVIPQPIAEKEMVATYPPSIHQTGNWGLVSGQIAQDRLIDYPLIFPGTREFLLSDQRLFWYSNPPFFLKSGKPVSPDHYCFSSLSFHEEFTMPDTLLIKQNGYPGWNAEINGKPTKIHNGPEGFMSIPIPQNTNNLKIFFHHPLIKWLLTFQLAYSLILVVLCLKWRNKSTA